LSRSETLFSENTINAMTEDQKPKPTGKEPVEDQENLHKEEPTGSKTQESKAPSPPEIIIEEDVAIPEEILEDIKAEDEAVTEEEDPQPESPEDTGTPEEEESEFSPMLSEEEEEDSKQQPPAKVDYSILSKAQLIKEFEFLLESKHVNSIRNELENLKINFYKKHKIELEKKRKLFLEEGGNVEDFQAGEDELELKFKEQYKQYRKFKAFHNRDLEEKKHDNLLEKQKILEELKDLVNRKEDVNRTFQEFRELQKKWHAIGMVPQQAVKDVWENYHLYVEQFYDHIKINKELRDLDLKKNLEAKIELCEKAEELLLDHSVINAFRLLQRYHDQWREIGPVPLDQKEVIWDRFKEVTHQINKKHQEHFDHLREGQKKNLEAKIALCEKAEAISAEEMKSLHDMDRLTKEMLELQRMWKTIGFAPKKDNNKIYQRFRSACDTFFSKKREYNAANREVMSENLQQKLDLCVQAEALQESTDWKKTTDELIVLQKRWKEIGPVPRKQYDSLWRRFRKACDNFFRRKSDYFSNIDTKYEDNLKKKLDLIERIENFKAPENVNEALNKLKEFQREWTEIGFVPIKSKEEIQKNYRAALDKHFDSLKMDDKKKNMVRFKQKLEGLSSRQNASNKISFEREKFMTKLKQLESDIVLWENNIGFFAKSKNADAMVKEFREKIEQGKVQIKLLEEKINLIDEMDQDS
jgi:hypothetical protein